MTTYMICANCGSDDVRRDASSVWSEEEQKWELDNTYDHAWCCSTKCDSNETRIIEVYQYYGGWFYVKFGDKVGPFDSRAAALADFVQDPIVDTTSI